MCEKQRHYIKRVSLVALLKIKLTVIKRTPVCQFHSAKQAFDWPIKERKKERERELIKRKRTNNSTSQTNGILLVILKPREN